MAGVTVVILALAVLAFRVSPSRQPIPGHAPSPRVAGAAALLATSAYWGPATVITADWYEWIGVVVWFTVVAAGIVVVSRWSRQQGWGDRHRFALAAGATLTYVWTAFPTRPEAEGSALVDLVGNALFGAVAVVLLVITARRLG
jgi:hypothetical protein